MPRETTWRCAVREVCSRGRGGRVTVHLERGRRPLAAAPEPDRHLSEVDKGGAESLRSPTRSSVPGLLEEHLAHAVPMGPGRQAGREMWHAEDGRPRGGVLSCILEALEEGVVARTVVEARDRRGAWGSGWDQASGDHVALVRSMALLVRRECY